MNIPKQITFIAFDSKFLTDTVREFCSPVSSTLGPGGCTVIIQDSDKELPHVTKDGVTVSESIFFEDKRKQAIAALIKESARKTAAAVGDGTTTSVVLAGKMILEGIDQMKIVTSHKEFFDGFDLAFEKAIDFLTESSIPITKDSKLLESVVKISANGDEKTCKVIMSAVKEAGPDGLVSVELGDELTTTVDIKGGSSLESNTFISGKRWEVEGENIELILNVGPIKEPREILPILSSVKNSKNSAIIIAKEFSEAVINTVYTNNQRKLVNVALVESEGFARQSRMDILEDLQVIFDVPLYSTDGTTELPLFDYSPAWCSELNKAIITPTETILFRANDTFSEAAEERYSKLKKEYEEEKQSQVEGVIDGGIVRHLQRRLAKYNVVATIKVGAATKAEAMESKDRIDDALAAITAAVNGGIIQGGGMALYRTALSLIEAMPADLTKDAKLGYQLMTHSCKAPIIVLAINSGVTFEKLPFYDMGASDVYDFRNFEIVDYISGGIVDPAMVPISALTNSSSVAKTILKSNSIISEWQDTTDVLS